MRRNALPAALGASLAALALAGCNALGGLAGNASPPEPVVDRAQSQAMLVAGHLDLLQRLLASGPAEQAEIVATARRDFDDAATPSRQLRYALVLATPGHASTDTAEAQRLLRELTATPESLVPAERALARLELAQLERQALLAAENRRLQAAVDRAERERNTTSSRRLQAELEENARLRKALEDAQKKLDAIANIERAITERKPQSEGRTP
ncbi:MAG: hypothetical protein AB7P31_02765 [Steroidobacteraceae bacterium]